MASSNQSKGPLNRSLTPSTLDSVSEKDIVNTLRTEKQKVRADILKERKASSFPIGIETRGYNRTKKDGLYKVILVTLTKSSGTISRKMIGRNQPMDKVSDLLMCSQVPRKGQSAKSFGWNKEMLQKFHDLYNGRLGENKKLIW